MKLVAVEGNTIWLDGGSMFGNAPKALWSQWIAPDDSNRIHLSCRVLLVQTDDGRNILFESGVGSYFDPKMRQRFGVAEEEHLLLKNLKSAGVDERDINAVVLSHLHFDHAGGLLSAYKDGPLRLLFPNARYYVGREHLERALKPHIRERASFIPLLHDLLHQSGRLVLVEGETAPDLDFGVTFRFVHGHTIGLMLAQIETDQGPIVFASDLVPGKAWTHLPITMGYDRFPELLVDEKRAVLEQLHADKGTLFFTHDPVVSFGKVMRDEKGTFTVTGLKRTATD